MADKNVKVTLVKSPIGSKPNQKKVLEGLGLKKLHHSVVLPDNAAVRGACDKVEHLVLVEEL
ncbi:MAG: 50S ribosomal protein L30 [Clostridiales bacterium]|nr:50S ribosomal protein L30 [Clostridiales bacterium]